MGETFTCEGLGPTDQAVTPGQCGEPVGAFLGDPSLGGVVDVYEPESLGEAPGPLEVVHQRPDEVAAQCAAVCDGSVGGSEMAVQVFDALGVGDGTVGTGTVGESRPVLGDVQRDRTVV